MTEIVDAPITIIVTEVDAPVTISNDVASAVITDDDNEVNAPITISQVIISGNFVSQPNEVSVPIITPELILADVISDINSINSFLQDIVGSGILDTITVSEDAGLDISWTTGKIYIDNGAKIFETNADSVILTDNSINYLYGISADLTIAVTRPDSGHALIAVIWTHEGNIHQLLQYPNIYEFQEAINDNLDQTHRQMVHDGIIASEHTSDTTNANSVIVDTGSYFVKPFIRTVFDSIFYSSGQDDPWSDNNIHRYFHTAGVWDDEDGNGVEFGVWDNGTEKTSCNPAKWYCGFIFVERTDHVDYMFPQVEHNSEADAIKSPIVYPPYHEEFTIPVARFIFRGNAVAFDGVAKLVDIRPIHGLASSNLSVAIQSLWKTITADVGSTIATASDSTLDMAGGLNISTAIVDDVVSIDLDIDQDVTFSGHKPTNLGAGTDSGDALTVPEEQTFQWSDFSADGGRFSAAVTHTRGRKKIFTVIYNQATGLQESFDILPIDTTTFKIKVDSEFSDNYSISIT